MKDSGHDSLDQQLAGLAPDITPSKDLWPDITRDIARDKSRDMTRAFHSDADRDRDRARAPRRRHLRLAAAAVVASACIASALTWAVVHSRSARSGAALRATQLQTVSFDDPRDKPYLAARADIEKTFHERLALLDPDTRTKIETSLDAIRQAHADIRQALVAQPDSPLLEQLLESTLHDEFDLYDQVVRTTQPAVSRI